MKKLYNLLNHAQFYCLIYLDYFLSKYLFSDVFLSILYYRKIFLFREKSHEDFVHLQYLCIQLKINVFHGYLTIKYQYLHIVDWLSLFYLSLHFVLNKIFQRHLNYLQTI